MRHRRPIGLAISAGCVVVALAACSGPSGPSGPGVHPSSRTTPRADAHHVKARPTYPLTGLPVTSATRAARPALSVKIDNISFALPQAGLNRADIVTEALVEGGLTRLLATFQSHNAPLIGPIRSARPVDADLLRELHGGVFAYSGADPREIAPVIAHSDAALVSNDDRPQWFQRSSDRPAPDNVMSSSKLLYKAGKSLRPHEPAPPHLFSYSATPRKGARRVKSVNLSFSAAATMSWTYRDHHYERTQDGAVDRLVGGQVINARNVVILSTKYYLTHIIDDAGNPDPYDLVTGSGRCWVLRDGTLTTGHWKRPNYRKPVRLLGNGGHTIDLHPGRTWIELLPPPELPHFT
jgi:hypothetical protein